MKFTQEDIKKGNEFMQTLIEKSWESAAFKEQLINNPVATIEEVMDTQVNKNVKIVVEDQTDSSIIYLT